MVGTGKNIFRSSRVWILGPGKECTLYVSVSFFKGFCNTEELVTKILGIQLSLMLLWLCRISMHCMLYGTLLEIICS